MLDEGRVAGGADQGDCLIKLLTEDGVSPGKIMMAVTSPKRAGCEEGADGERPSKKVVFSSVPNDFMMPTIQGPTQDASPLPLRWLTLAAETEGAIDKAQLVDSADKTEKATKVWTKNTEPFYVTTSIYTDITCMKAYFCISLKFDDSSAVRFIRDRWVHITLGTWYATSTEYKCPTQIIESDAEDTVTYLSALLAKAFPRMFALHLCRNRSWRGSWSYELADNYQKSVAATLQCVLIDSAKLFGYDIEYPESLHVSWI